MLKRDTSLLLLGTGTESCTALTRLARAEKGASAVAGSSFGAATPLAFALAALGDSDRTWRRVARDEQRRSSGRRGRQLSGTCRPRCTRLFRVRLAKRQ